MNAVPKAVLAYRPAVRQGLESYIGRWQRDDGTGLRWPGDVAGRLLDFGTVGKLLRGSLVCYSYALCGGEEPLPPAVVDTAAALELAHAAFLIHDDIIDRDELRRGRPAMHAQYRRLLAAPDAAHLGNGLAICAGDMILLKAFALLGSRAPLGSLLARELAAVCAGQMEDVYAAASAGQPAKRKILALMRAKSAGYSLALPLKAGAVLAGQPAGVQERLYAIGLAAGTIFQIRDDELGVLGNARQLGKPVGADIRENKKTLLYYYLWQSAGAKERRRLATVFGNPDAGPADIAAVRQALLDHGVPARLQADLDRLRQTAERHIIRLDVPPFRQRELRQIVDFCAQREV